MIYVVETRAETTKDLLTTMEMRIQDASVTILCGVEFATSARFKISYDGPGSRNERVKRMDGLQKSQRCCESWTPTSRENRRTERNTKAGLMRDEEEETTCVRLVIICAIEKERKQSLPKAYQEQ